jgi:hypothetical protein
MSTGRWRQLMRASSRRRRAAASGLLARFAVQTNMTCSVPTGADDAESVTATALRLPVPPGGHGEQLRMKQGVPAASTSR